MDWEKVFEIVSQNRAEKAFDKRYGPRVYKTVKLPESEWYRCTHCDGTGKYFEQGDLHRSPGIVPCGCGDGWVRTKTVEVKRKIRVKAGSQHV